MDQGWVKPSSFVKDILFFFFSLPDVDDDFGPWFPLDES